ncbi:uncharacterized protein LOC124162363 isoform X2 [Ischnura elegans]|uniref:uncharacterized protein LOC124162363 isoform X2 n=1 Tax=Ischnura elegans TaxID=197161 RepID=UPI001ED86BFD|nr:uncharacterized protein LOC124162363 isoform X2 [Ischnura elegans]
MRVEEEGLPAARNCPRSVPHTCGLVWLNCCIVKSELTINIIHKLSLLNPSKSLQHELNLFTHQLMHNKVVYSVYEVFTVDKNLLYSMNGAFSMCFIVLMQMKVSDLHFH